jgi:hypothetical protein
VEPSRVVRACLWERAWGGVCNGRGVAAQAREMRDQKTTREAMRRGSPVFPGRADRMESRRRDTAQNSTAEAGSRKGDIGIRQQPTPLLSHSEDATLPSLWAKLVNRQAGAGTGAGLLSGPGVLGGARQVGRGVVGSLFGRGHLAGQRRGRDSRSCAWFAAASECVAAVVPLHSSPGEALCARTRWGTSFCQPRARAVGVQHHGP